MFMCFRLKIENMLKPFTSWAVSFRNTPRWVRTNQNLSRWITTEVIWRRKNWIPGESLDRMLFLGPGFSFCWWLRWRTQLVILVFLLCVSPGRRCLCWGTATFTSRTSAAPQTATSSWPSCTRRWRTTNCTTPSPCTEPGPILKPPRPPLLWTTPTPTPRYHTCSWTHLDQDLFSKLPALLRLLLEFPVFLLWSCLIKQKHV